MIPVSLYGISVERCDEFFQCLPELVADLHDDLVYTETLFTIDDGITIAKLHVIDSWAGYGPQAWPEDVVQELVMALMTVRYPDVGLVEHLLTLDGLDAVRVSNWLHFLTNVYPIYSEKACEALDKLGVPTPFRPDDIASYGLYVQRLEGLKLHAPAAGLPEIGLPRARVLQIGLERFV
jgi:hypothetical protein